MKKKFILLFLAILLFAGLFYGYFGLRRAEGFYWGIPISCFSTAQFMDFASNGDEYLRNEAAMTLANIDRSADLTLPGPGTRAVNIENDGSTYMVVIVQRSSLIVAFDEAFHLVSLERSGKILDRVSAFISNRFADRNSFRCEVLSGEDDGAQLVIRSPIPMRNEFFRYFIELAGKTYRFTWGPDGECGKLPSSELEKLGLCRIAVKDGKFKVLYANFEKAKLASDD
jgi:hypothetical protein